MIQIKKKIRSSGGHKNPSYVVSIPLKWCHKLGLSKNSDIYLTLDCEKIILSMYQEDKKVEISLEERLESRFE